MKRATKILMSAFCAAVMCFGAFAMGACGGAKTATVTISGSSSVTPVMEKLAAEYEKTHDVRITINMSSSGNGIKDTQNGLNDFGMSSRDLKDKETGVKGEVLCRDGIALIVNKDCAVDNVTKADVKALYESGTAIPDTSITAGVGRDEGSGTRSAFDELLEIESYAGGVSTVAETGNVIESIQGATNSIGYVSYGSLSDKVKAVSLDGVACTTDNIVNGTYALQRPFLIVLKEGSTLSEAARGFYDFIMSAEAQTIITANKYVSVK